MEIPARFANLGLWRKSPLDVFRNESIHEPLGSIKKMETNTEYYSSEFDASIQKFIALPDLHPVLDEFRTLVTNLDIESCTAKIVAELEENVNKFWTNPAFRKENFDTSLDAILLEYNCMDEIDSKVYAYGLIDMKTQSEEFEKSI